MNEQLPYEKKLAEKLEEITVPDMQNYIWNKVEIQLDNFPSTSGKTDGGGISIAAGWKVWLIIAAAATVIVITILYLKRSNRIVPPIPPKEQLRNNVAPAKDSSSQSIITIKTTQLPSATPAVPVKITKAKKTAKEPKVFSDTTIALPVTIASSADSTIVSKKETPLAVDSVKPPPPFKEKKPMGIQIKPDEYIIDGKKKKDST